MNGPLVFCYLLAVIAAATACAQESQDPRGDDGGLGGTSVSTGAQGGGAGTNARDGGRSGSAGSATSGAGGAGGASTGRGGASGRGGTAGAGGSGTGGTGAGGGGTGTGGSGAGGSSAGGSSAGGSGTGGSGAGGSGTGTACMPGAPSPPAGGANFPFPQHRLSSRCVYPPACSDVDVTAAWETYKARTVVDGGGGSLRVQRPENGNDTVSEGISYGMIFAVYMNDKTAFDKIWQYAQMHLDGNGLMHWRIGPGGDTQGANSATDADEDIGFALVMADKQWGGYSVTRDYLGRVLAHDFQSDGTIKGGDNFDDVNPSYLAPAFYKVFATYTGEARWTQVVDKSYEILNGAANATTGLVPDWSSGGGSRDYRYDAARTPFRIGLDACWTGDPRAVAFSQKIAAFFGRTGVPAIRDGYRLDGSVIGQFQNATFVGPAGVSGMAGNQAKLVSDAYNYVATIGRAGTDNYYNLSWGLFSTLLMTGNFINLAAP